MNVRFLSSLLFPPECLSCAKRIVAGMLCAECRAGIAINSSLPQGDPSAPCVVTAAAPYHIKALQALIHNLKFRGARDAAEPIANILIAYAERVPLLLEDHAVVPIPLSRERLRERGFNQAELIAAPFAAHFGTALETNLLARIVHRKPQSETASLAEREENIRGAFAVNPWRAEKIKNVILIDDVTTSGATFLEAAGALRAAGVQKIIALAAARA